VIITGDNTSGQNVVVLPCWVILIICLNRKLNQPVCSVLINPLMSFRSEVQQLLHKLSLMIGLLSFYTRCYNAKICSSYAFLVLVTFHYSAGTFILWSTVYWVKKAFSFFKAWANHKKFIEWGPNINNSSVNLPIMKPGFELLYW